MVAVCPGPDGLPLRATILVVDNEALVRRCIRLMLESAGYAVVEASGGLEALHLLAAQGNAVRLVLTDCAMPGMDGWAVLRAIRATSPELPVMLMSGGGQVVPHDAALETCVLEKPFTGPTLVRRVRSLLQDD
jgi:CheY-like chemotaxis protein